MKIFSKSYIGCWWKVIVATFMGFINDNGLKLSASLAYYTVFSIAPLIILVISISSLVLRHYSFNDALYGQMSQLLGQDATNLLQLVVMYLALSCITGAA